MLLLYLLQTAPNALLTTRVIFALVCVIVASSLALGVCVGLVRRMQIISPERAEPSQDDEQDSPDQPASRP